MQKVLWVALALVACTKSNPAKHCADGTCLDPSYPFCDITGSIAGEPGACIATSCTMGAFVECRGDVEVRCNVDGSNYNLAQCERGCDDALGGCRLCNPGETACTNGKVASCDATGTITDVESCPLGCFGSEPRCREINPSNGLAMYFDMVPDPPSLVIENGRFTVETGAVVDNGQPITVPSFSVAAPVGGVALRVFVVDSLTITQATAAYADSGGPALVFLARGDIKITGRLAAAKAGSPVALPACSAGPGLGPTSAATTCGYTASASGGGAFATNGAKGGDRESLFLGGSGGIANGNEQLIPLRGGCPSGQRFQASARNHGFGGGAIQLVSRTRILIDGVVDVRGDVGGLGGWACPVGSGACSSLESGGAGGGVLIEAPSIELGPNGSLDTTGGAGGQCFATTRCAMGGSGATPGVAAVPGANINPDCVLQANRDLDFAPGGGGGGLGRIRINTADATYLKSSTAYEGGAVTAGMIITR